MTGITPEWQNRVSTRVGDLVRRAMGSMDPCPERGREFSVEDAARELESHSFGDDGHMRYAEWFGDVCGECAIRLTEGAARDERVERAEVGEGLAEDTGWPVTSESDGPGPPPGW
jgi:hypothetical protein